MGRILTPIDFLAYTYISNDECPKYDMHTWTIRWAISSQMPVCSHFYVKKETTRFRHKDNNCTIKSCPLYLSSYPLHCIKPSNNKLQWRGPGRGSETDVFNVSQLFI